MVRVCVVSALLFALASCAKPIQCGQPSNFLINNIDSHSMENEHG